MFNGLSVKSSDGGRLNSSNSSSTASAANGHAINDGSGFSFLCSNPPINADRSIPSPINQQGEDDLVASDMLLPSPAGVTSSGFSFLSSPMVPQQPKHEVILDSAMTNPNTVTGTDNGPSNSGFSFLSGKLTAATTQVAMEEKAGFEPSSSAFSFLNSSVGVSTTQHQQQIPKEYTLEKEERITSPPSAFSFLSQGALQPSNSLNSEVAMNSLPNLAPSQSKGPSHTVIANNPLVSNNSNPATAALTAENMHIPAPSTIGVVFEGASKPGAIQKKRRGKKIGVGAQDQQEAISNVSESTGATISTTSHQYQHPTVSHQEEGAENLRTAAAVAAERAEQFILQKQKEIGREVHTTTTSSDSSSILHMGRYGTSKESKNETMPPDATVEAAERAAKEAQHLMVNGGGNNTTTKNSIMSGFFGRTSKKFGFHLGNTSNHDKGTVGPTPHDGNHSSTNSPPRQNPSDSSIPSESAQEPPDPPASSHFTTPTRSGTLSFIIPAPTLSINSGITNVAHDGITKKDESIDQATMQRRIEEERRAQFKEQERQWQAAQKEREESERIAREKEEERLRKLAEEERRKNRSPQEKMDELLAEFSSEAQQAMKLVVELRNQKAIIEKERNNSEKQLRCLAQQQSLTERQQLAAAEAEDFDLADRFAAVIEKLSKDYNEQEAALNGIQRALSHLETQQNEHTERVIDCFSRVKNNLKLLRDEQECERKEGSNEVQHKFVTTAKKISSETERLAIEKEHLERDEEVVNNERHDLEELIHSETAEEECLRIDALSKLETVKEEIEALKSKLAEKEAEAVNLSLSISSHEASISKVRSKFSRQQGRVNKKELALKENRNEWEADSRALSLLKGSHEKEVQLHSEELLKYEQLMDGIKNELTNVETMETVISEHLSVLNDGSLTESSSDVCEQESGVVEYQAAVDEAKEELRAALEGLEALREEVIHLERQIPLFEQQKVAAVSARDFKAAGKASKDIKEAIARKEQCEQEIKGEVTHRITKMTKSLEKYTSILKEKEKEVRQKEHEQSQFSMAKLANKISELELIKEEAEKARGGVAAVVSAILVEEINILYKEGADLGEKFGGWSDFLVILSKSNEEEDQNVNASTQNDSEKANVVEQREFFDNETCSLDGMKPSITNETIAKWNALCERIMTLEESLENAVANEDYEAAANIDDEMQMIKSEKENMGLTEDDVNIAIESLALQHMSESDAGNPLDTDAAATLNCQSTDEVELNMYSNFVDDVADSAANEEILDSHGDGCDEVPEFEDDDEAKHDHSDEGEHETDERGCLI